MEAEIKNRWFKDHVATVTEHEGVTILDWRKPGTNMYAVRYIFSGNRLFISGDLGDAIYWLTWKATIASFEDVGLHYLMGKLTCCSRERWNFDEDKARKELKDWYKESIEGYEDDKEVVSAAKEISHAVEGIIPEYSYFQHYNNAVGYVLQDLNQDVFDYETFAYIADFGKSLPIVFVAYLLGIKMANEQIKTTNIA